MDVGADLFNRGTDLMTHGDGRLLAGHRMRRGCDHDRPSHEFGEIWYQKYDLVSFGRFSTLTNVDSHNQLTCSADANILGPDLEVVSIGPGSDAMGLPAYLPLPRL